MSTKGIDISVWNGTLDFAKIKNSGFSFAIIRAGYGRETSQKDTKFETYYSGAKSAGLKIGAYWYSYAKSTSEAEKEAAACLACIKGKSFDLPVYLDMEETSQFNLGKSACTNIAITFCKAIEAAGYKAGVYSNYNWYTNVLDRAKIAKSYSIWLAQWSTVKSYDCDIWQYRSDGTISGHSGNFDFNECYTDFSSSSGSSSSGSSSTASGSSSVKTVQAWVGVTQDGIYGSATKKALVKRLQTELNKQCGAGLTVDGIWGANTRNAVAKWGTLSQGMSGNLTKTLQGLLICNGYSTNGFDGVYGGGTASAVKKYQSANGLTADGIAGAATFAKLCG